MAGCEGLQLAGGHHIQHLIVGVLSMFRTLFCRGCSANHCRLDLQNIRFTDSHPGDANQSVHLVAGEGQPSYLPLADMVDISAEVQRLSKMQTKYDGLVARLSSPKFVEKAPEEVVHGVQEKAAEAEEKINLTKNHLDFLKSTVVLAE